MKNTYLAKLRNEDMLLFILVLFFILGQLFFTIKGVETFPFLNYGMYSAPIENQDSITIYRLNLCGQNISISKLTDCQKDIVYNTICQYDLLRQSQIKENIESIIDHRFKNKCSVATLQLIKSRLLNNKQSFEDYPKWLLHYLADMRLVNNATLEIQKCALQYDTKGNIHITSAQTLISYAE